jgi:hypothetical protein
LLCAGRSPTSVYAIPTTDVSRLGTDPIAIDLEVWDGSRIEVAAGRGARLDLVGSFLVAAVSALPTAPAPAAVPDGQSGP